ncbi:auxin transporter-like protein 5 [Lathyrus oleraceus]|uniref:auxin transporter-like protein 5 n=1 Tax=Pisum sativum TaxID=3888 RepID=UPI0021D1EA5A|nr:auxin transporter-like protein 5 [Pisum sativum]
MDTTNPPLAGADDFDMFANDDEYAATEPSSAENTALIGKHWRNVGLAFNCIFLLFGSVIQLIACASNIYYINDNLDKRTWTYIFGACCATTVFIPSFHNYRIWSFLDLVMTTYTAWYLTIAAILHGQMEGVKHSGPNKMVLYFTGATNILYTFGGHAVTVEIMHAMWKPQKFKAIYLMATLYVLTLTLPSAAAVYWAFGDMLLNHSNALMNSTFMCDTLGSLLYLLTNLTEKLISA